MTISNVSLVTLYCTDQDAAKKFYVEELGFVENTDVSMGNGFRWVTINHPAQPELEVTLMIPGPPLDEDMAAAVSRALAQGIDGWHRPHHRRLPQDLRGAERARGRVPAAAVDRPYGVEAVMRDNSGNWMVLVEPKEFDPSQMEDFGPGA